MRHSNSNSAPRLRPERAAVSRTSPALAFTRVIGALFTWLLLISPAYAESAGVIVVPEFQGAKPSSIRTLVIDLLRAEGHEIASDDKTPKVNASGSDEHFVELAKQAQVRAFVLGNTELDTKTWATSISVREGKTGRVIGSVVIESGWYPGLQKALKQRLVSHISSALAAAQAPEQEAAKPVVAAAAVEPVREEPPPEKPAEPPPSTPPKADPVRDEPPPKQPRDKLSALHVDLGPAFLQRSWVISDSLPGTLDGPLSPEHDASLLGLQLHAVIYPAAFGTKSFLSNIGLQLRFLRSLYGQTPINDADGEDPRTTTFQEWGGDLRVRIPLGKLQLGAFAGFGMQSLTLSGEKVLAALPDTNYSFYRAGGDVRMELTPQLAASAGAAFRGVLSAGEESGQLQAAEWFPGTKALGLDAELNLDYAFDETWGLRVGGSVRRYVMAFDPDPAQIEAAADAGDPAPPIAGGATDLYLGGHLSVVVTL